MGNSSPTFSFKVNRVSAGMARCLFTFLLLLCTAVGAWATEVTFTTSDIQNNSEKTFTKSGITLTTTSNNEKSNGFKITDSSTLTVSSTSGNITSIVFTYQTYGAGVSTTTGSVTGSGPQTWTGSATSVEFSATKTCKISQIVVTTNGSTTDPETPATGIIYDWKTNTGTTAIGSGISSTSPAIKIGGTYNKPENCVTIAPASGTFKAGDKVSVTIYTTSSKTPTLGIFSDLTAAPLYSANATKSSQTITYTLEEDADQLYLGRSDGSGTLLITAINVTRSNSETKTLTASISEHSKTVYVSNTTQTLSLPTLTVKAGDETLTSDKYTVTYSSDNESVAKVDNGQLVIGTTVGIAHITYTISSSSTEGYSAATLTYTVTVKDKAALVISASDITINSVDATLTQPTIRVYDENNNRLTAGTDYTLSLSLADGASTGFSITNNALSVTKSDDKWATGTATIIITATPTDATSGQFKASTDSITYTIVDGKLVTKFLPAFSSMSIKVKAGESATTTVPVIYDGTDISDYFTYTYKIVTEGAKSSIKTESKYITFMGNSADTQVQVSVSVTPKKDGDNDFSDIYQAPTDLTFTVNVSSDYIVPTVSIDPKSIKLYAGESTDVPDVTIKNGSTEMSEDAYQLTWISFSPNVASVSNGTIQGLSEGTAEIHLIVSGSNVQSTTETVTVTVDDPNIFRISKDNASNITQNNTLWNTAHTMRVTLGGWLFPNNVTITSGATSEALGDGEWTSAAKVTKSTEKISGFDYMAGGTKCKNARQENGSNAQPYSTKAYGSTKNLLENVTILDPMFNVPCAGSYLVVESKSLGTATVYIYQNGVFDQSGNNKQYRPQRRVFVLDEAGQAQKTTARIGNTVGKPGGGYTLSDYSWDWGGTDNATPTVEMVKKHFNLSSFEMSSTGFKNGVYANCLTYDESGNEYLNGKSYDNIKGMEAGYRGWSILADGPVAYTFDTKPGKTYYVYNYGSRIGLYGFAFEEKTATVDALTYSESSENSENSEIKATADDHVATVSLDREFKAGIWNAAVLPFSLHKQQIDAIFGTTYSKDNEDGTQILYFDHTEGSTIYFHRHAYNTIVAGKPFLIKPTKDAKINTAELEDFPYVTIEKETAEDFGLNKSTADYCWHSDFKGQTIAAGDYFIRDAEANSKAADGKVVRLPVSYTGTFTINGFRGYLKAKDETTRQNAKAMTIAMTDLDDETTYIENVTIDEDGTLRPALTGKVFNLQGQLVSTDATQLDNLPKGIYVVNGNKVTVK